ncbi:MAG: malonate transporter subunit MadL [Chitinophagia bacterium]|nr:malonate transporter subunit MadL [Chitinophagia bacterium]
MKIYGVAFLSACFLAGQVLGELLGRLFHFQGNIGGVGFGMLLLIVLGDRLKRKGWMGEESESGIHFWNAMYIPVVVAMATTQNVKAAVAGGWLAVAVGVGGTLACFLLIPVMARLGRKSDTPHNENDKV